LGDRRFCWGWCGWRTLLLEAVLRETVLRGETTASSSKNKKSERKWRATKKDAASVLGYSVRCQA